jgi:hypothetical protein
MINGRSYFKKYSPVFEGQIGFPIVLHIALQLIEKDYKTGRTKTFQSSLIIYLTFTLTHCGKSMYDAEKNWELLLGFVIFK